MLNSAGLDGENSRIAKVTLACDGTIKLSTAEGSVSSQIADLFGTWQSNMKTTAGEDSSGQQEREREREYPVPAKIATKISR